MFQNTAIGHPAELWTAVGAEAACNSKRPPWFPRISYAFQRPVWLGAARLLASCDHAVRRGGNRMLYDLLRRIVTRP